MSFPVYTYVKGNGEQFCTEAGLDEGFSNKGQSTTRSVQMTLFPVLNHAVVAKAIVRDGIDFC